MRMTILPSFKNGRAAAICERMFILSIGAANFYGEVWGIFLAAKSRQKSQKRVAGKA